MTDVHTPGDERDRLQTWFQQRGLPHGVTPPEIDAWVAGLDLQDANKVRNLLQVMIEELYGHRKILMSLTRLED